MSLAEIWKNTPAQLKGKTVHQILAFAGDGTLKDGNSTSEEFRELLAHVPSALLAEYTNNCLSDSFKDSGLVLQDIANQIGKRLGFKVEPGRYRGTAKASDIGFDGLWEGPDRDAIIVEVKTTDAYRMSLDTAADYRKLLIKNGRVSEDRSSILYVVGRNDTGELEAQVRGSRHAWDIRIISIDSLIRLMTLKEELQDPLIMRKIRDILVPQEYTRVDQIIDLVFSAAAEVKPDDDEPDPDEEDGNGNVSKKDKKFTPVAFRDACISRISRAIGETLVKRTAAIFATPDDSKGVYCAISRTYKKAGGSGYWFAFHPVQKEALLQFPEGLVCFGCGSEKQILKIPVAEFVKWLELFNTTEKDDRTYWHIHAYQKGSEWELHTKKKHEQIDVTRFLMK